MIGSEAGGEVHDACQGNRIENRAVARREVADRAGTRIAQPDDNLFPVLFLDDVIGALLAVSERQHHGIGIFFGVVELIERGNPQHVAELKAL